MLKVSAVIHTAALVTVLPLLLAVPIQLLLVLVVSLRVEGRWLQRLHYLSRGYGWERPGESVVRNEPAGKHTRRSIAEVWVLKMYGSRTTGRHAMAVDGKGGCK